MTIKELIDAGCFEVLCCGQDTQKCITVPFCCDLLSVAMASAPEGCAWVTVMGNINTLAVASLTDAACIILAGGTVLDDAALQKAEEQDITILRSRLPIFESALQIHNLLHD